MSVGKTPQITKDIIVNSYTLNQENILPNANISTVTTSGNTPTGNTYDLINPNNDGSTVVFAIQLYRTYPASSSYEIIFDLKKSIFISNLSIIYAMPTIAGSTSLKTITVSYGDDLNNLQNNTDFNSVGNGTVPKTTITKNYFRARFIKISFTGTSTENDLYHVNLYSINAITDFMQN